MKCNTSKSFEVTVIPAKAGIQVVNLPFKNRFKAWIPAFAGMTTLVVALAGCGPAHQMARAKKLEQQGAYYKAWEKYQSIAADHPQHGLAPEAVFRAGWVAQRHFDDCFMAATFYDEVLTRYPDSDPWARAALLQKNNCPDYFPLIVGSSWTEVDSDTKGNNARIEVICEKVPGLKSDLPSQSGRLVKNFFAGSKKSLTTELDYKKAQLELQEIRSGQETSPVVVLKWPVETGAKWTTRNEGKNYTYEISSLDQKISVVAGDFQRCLQVRSYLSGEAAVKNEYYAPGVGRILTSVTTKSGEKRITELASYNIADLPDFSDEGKKE